MAGCGRQATKIKQPGMDATPRFSASSPGIALALLAGATLAAQLPHLPSAVLVIGLFAAAVVCAWRWRRARLLAIAMFGAAWFLSHAQWSFDQRLDPALQDRNLVVTGTVSGVPDRNANGTKQFDRAAYNHHYYGSQG